MIPDLKQLLLETHRGSESSARVLWNTQAPRLLQYARAIVASAADAEDVVQSVFCRILDLARREVERVNDPAAWLAQVARREAINSLRSRRREAARRETAGALRLRRGDAADPRDSSDPDLQAAIDRLPRRLREMVVLKHVAGLTFEQIAEATGLNRNTAAARYRAAIESLQRLMPADDEHQADRGIRSTIPVQEASHGR